MLSNLPAFEPTHPGELLREEIIPASKLAVIAVAERLGVSRQALHAVLAGRSGVSPEMALRLARLFGTSPQMWLNMQANHDLWHLTQAQAADLERIKTLEHA